MCSAEDFYRLQLDNFQSSVVQNLQDIRSDENFFDVTLACDETGVVRGHKVVLSASSAYFKAILRRSPANQHTVIFLPEGIEHKILSEVVDFIYSGEIRLSAQDLEPFIALTNYLKIRGLSKDQGWSSGCAPAKLDSGDPGAILNARLQVEPKQAGSKRANPKNWRQRSKEKSKKVLINSWTSNLDDNKVEIKMEDKNQDDPDSQDLSNQHVKSDLTNPDAGQMPLNGLRLIKFQCHQCMEVFSEKLAFVQHVIRAHKPDRKPKEGLTNSSNSMLSSTVVSEEVTVQARIQDQDLDPEGPPYCCETCGQLFKHLRCLESHRRRIHSRSKSSGPKKGFEPETLVVEVDDDDGIELRKVVVTGSHIGPRPKA